MRDDDEHTDDQYHDHMHRIDAIIRRWRANDISATGKRKLIAQENQMYYRGDCKSPVNGERITRLPRHYSGTAPLTADAAMVPLEAAELALAARRRGNWEAAERAETVEEARAMAEAGERACADILAAAREAPR